MNSPSEVLNLEDKGAKYFILYHDKIVIERGQGLTKKREFLTFIAELNR
jgi:hypothetical protein